MTLNEITDLDSYYTNLRQNLIYLGGYNLEANFNSLPPHLFRRKLLEIEIDLKRTLENVQKARSLAKNL